jgi:hypothetical protein
VKANFVPPGYEPKFKVYDYWYNLLVDYLNASAVGGVTTTVGTVVVSETGLGNSFLTTLTLTNFIIGHVPAAAAALVVVPITPVCAFPAGVHVEEVYYQSLSLKLPGTVVNADLGLGSVAGAGAADATLNVAGATQEDRLTGQTVPTAPTGGAVTTALRATTAGALTGISLNVAASVKNVFLNCAGTWNVDNHSDLYATGTIKLKWYKIV